MLDPRAILIAAAAAGLTANNAQALTPSSMDLFIDTMAAEEPSGDGVFAVRARAPEAHYAPAAWIADHTARLQCVPFVRAESGVEIFGDASTWWEQAAGRYQRAAAPDSGAVLVLSGYEQVVRGHVALVREIISPRLIVVDHANWFNTGEITRNVPVRDVSAAGDWSQVQVWNAIGHHWGGRVYNVQGFIRKQAAGDDIAG